MVEYKVHKEDVTMHMSKLFDNVKAANVSFSSLSSTAVNTGYFTEKEISENDFQFAGDSKLEIEFNSGKVVCFSVSEYGSVKLKKESMPAEDQKVVDDFVKFMDNLCKTSGLNILNIETVEDYNKQARDAQEIHNCLKKLPAGLYLSIFHIMQQEITGLPCSGNYCV